MITKQALLNLTPRDRQLIKHYLIGGAALGGAAGLGTSLVNYLSSLRQDAKKDTSQDDDVYYLNMGEQPSKKASLGGGLAMAGGALGAIGTYALVRRLYEANKRRELQAKLDAAQQGFTGAIQDEAAVKKQAAAAGKPMSGLETVTSLPVAATLLLALASGVVANRALGKTFPLPNKAPTSLRPRKLVVRQPGDDVLDDEEKSASAQERDAFEFLARVVLSSEKVASNTDLADLTAAVADNRADEFKWNMLNFGPGAALDLIKGAAANGYSVQGDRSLGIMKLACDTGLRPIASTLLAAEFREMAPTFMAAAAELSADKQDTLFKLAADLGSWGRCGQWEDLIAALPAEPKEAAALAEEVVMPELLESALDKVLAHRKGAPGAQQPGHHDPNKPEDDLTSGQDADGTEGDQASRVTPLEARGPGATAFARQNKDVIDEVLAGKDEEQVPQEPAAVAA